MTRPNHRHDRTVLAIAFAAMLIVGLSASALAADPPVQVTFAKTGDANFGASVTVKATVKINDGSTLQTLAWSQAHGAHATLANTATDTVSVALPDRKTFKEELITVLTEPPTENLPGHVPPPENYTGGLLDRWSVVGGAVFAFEEAADVGLKLTVTTSSGAYNFTYALPVNVPWHTATGGRNVPIGRPVVLHGKTQATYNWTLAVPTGSTAALIDGTSQNPDFTPDVAGTYKVTVTDIASGKPVTLDIHAGTWTGVIKNQTAEGLPVADTACTVCHVPNTPNFDMFTPWAKSGHANIFSDQVKDPKNHYGENCISCHTVGFDKAVNNGGIDDAVDYQKFLDAKLFTPGAPGNWTRILAEFPATAKLANIQCENCHGPQSSPAHMKKDGSRNSLSSDMCGTCHGEPARHGRFQQWQLSGHANTQLAIDEMSASCAKCHTGQGFVQWAEKGFSTAALTVTWTADDVVPQTCAVCHDPHFVGTSTGETTDANMRVQGDTPMLDAGFKATNVGKGAICMTCHNGRRGLRDDAHFSAADATRAPHVGPQTDILMGQNLYFATVGQRGFHAMIQDSCVTCHMEATDPPADLSYQLGGTNHTFFASKTICAKCHTSITAESVQGPVEHKMEALKAEIETAIKGLMQAQIRAGNKIDLGGKKMITNAADIASVEFIESHGRQGVNVTLADGTAVNDLSLASVKVVRPSGSPVDLYSISDPAIGKAGYNYWAVHSDASKGVHNPGFVSGALDVSLYAVKAINSALTTPAPTTPSAGIGGGIGNGAGAVACSTPYVYWAEVAAHLAGAEGSQWRTDIIARNLGTSPAALRFVLHQAEGNLEGTGAVNASSQKAFEDIVATLGGMNNKGSLEICSDQPLLVAGRIFNQDAKGTFGQNFDGHVADLGYGPGQTISLIGLRQKTGAYRSNLTVANAGKTDAEVAITLFDAAGAALTSYNLTVPAGLVAQDIAPFAARANKPDVDWGFATVTVLKGTNLRVSASMIDMNTNDPTTIEAKQ